MALTRQFGSYRIILWQYHDHDDLWYLWLHLQGPLEQLQREASESTLGSQYWKTPSELKVCNISISKRKITRNWKSVLLKNCKTPSAMKICSIGKWEYTLETVIVGAHPLVKLSMDLYFTCLGFWCLLVASILTAAKLSTLGTLWSSLPGINVIFRFVFDFVTTIKEFLRNLAIV